MKSSHGFLKRIFKPELIMEVERDLCEFIKSEKILSNYYSQINKNVPSVEKLLEDNIKELVSELVNTKNYHLCNIEFHIQIPNCAPIPPHQDNFYHCVGYSEGVKLLVPTNSLHANNGGLIYLDIPYDYPILDHVPSNVPNFSSIIHNDIFKSLEINTKSYDYKTGDASYHYLNSIHFSKGNKTNKLSSFLVFRFEAKKITKDLSAIRKYEECFNKHQRRLFS